MLGHPGVVHRGLGDGGVWEENGRRMGEEYGRSIGVEKKRRGRSLSEENGKSIGGVLGRRELAWRSLETSPIWVIL